MLDLLPVAQFKKREEQPLRHVTFIKVSGFKLQYTKSITHPCDFHVIEIVQMAPNRVKRHKKCGEGSVFF